MPQRAPVFLEGLFPTHGPVPPADVVGRAEAVEAITFKVRSGQHVLVAGPRRIGKSSVAGKALAQAAEHGVLVVAVDFFQITTLAAFVEAMFDACAQHVGPVRGAWGRLRAAAAASRVDAEVRASLGPFLQLGLRLHSEHDPEALLDHAMALPGLLAERRGSRVAVLCDEFQEAGRLHGDFYRVLRHHASSAPRVSYVFLGSRSGVLRQLFARSAEPLYRAAFEVDLPDPSPDEWVAYLERKLATVGITPSPACLSRIVAETGAHPQDTMLVAGALYERLYRERRPRCGEEDAAAAVGSALSGLQTAFAAEWERLSVDRGARIALSRVAKGDPVHSGLTRAESKAAADALRRLTADGLLLRAGRGRYRMREPLFAAYVAETMRA